MLSKKHPTARCRHCGSPLYYGLKREAAGWKVHYSCPPPEGCGRECSCGRIEDDGVKDAYRRAAEFGENLR